MLEFFRRFGIQYCDLPTMIDNVAFLLRTLTVNIQRGYTKGIPSIWYIVMILASGSYFYVDVFSMLWFISIRCRETRDLVAASVIYSLAACSYAGIIRLLFIRFYNDAIMDLVEEYLAFDALVEQESRYSANLHKALKYVKRRAAIFWLYLSVNGTLYVVIAIVQPGRHLPEDLLLLFGLEPTFETPNYEITFALVTISVYLAVSTETYTAVLVVVLAGYAEAQMLALSEELNNLWKDAAMYLSLLNELPRGNKTNENSKIMNEYIQNKLRDIVDKHTTIISLINKVENIFKGAKALEFGCASSGLIAELLGGLENTYVQLPYTLLQVAINCFIGQRVIDASLVLENAVYCCKWENFDLSNQKVVLLILLNSQKTLRLSAGGLTILSFTSLMSILKSIYSVYTALRSRM